MELTLITFMCLISALEGFHFANHPYIKYMGHGSTPVEAPKHEPKPEPVHEMPMMKDEMMMEKEMMKMDHPMPMSHHYQPYHAPNPTHYHQPYHQPAPYAPAHPVAHHAPAPHHAPVHHAPVHHAPLHHAPVHHAPVHHASAHHAPVHHALAPHHAPVHHAPVHHAPVHHAPVHHMPYHHENMYHQPAPYAPGYAPYTPQYHQYQPYHQPSHYQGSGYVMKPEMMKDEHKEMMMDDHKMMDMMEKKPELPKEKEPMYMGTFSKASHGVEGDIFLLDEKTIYIQGFSFDGEAPDVHFWSDGVAIPYYTRTNPHVTMQVGKYTKEDVVLMLPPEKPTIKELGHFQVWCRQFGINFGEFAMPPHAHV